MSENKFTAGPWKVFYAPNNGAMLGIGVDRPEDADHAQGVADAYGGLWGSGGEKEANAHLIAAAPDLLEALELAKSALEEAEAILGGEYGDHYATLCSTMHDLREKSDVALSKARGEA